MEAAEVTHPIPAPSQNPEPKRRRRPRVTTIEGLAERFGWSVATLRTWRRHGVFAPIGMAPNGKSPLYNVAEVEKAITAAILSGKKRPDIRHIRAAVKPSE